MYYKRLFYIIYFIILLHFALSAWNNRPNHIVDNIKPEGEVIRIVWCTISVPEYRKCRNFALHNENDKIKVGRTSFVMECIQVYNKDECAQQIDIKNATLTTLDAGSLYVGGRYHSIVPIAQELLRGGLPYYHAVAVIKKNTLPHVRSLYDLRGLKACFAGVETYAGWMLPIYTLMREGGMEIIDCNNHIKSATHYFGESCAVNLLLNKFNPIGDNSGKLCKLCRGRIPGDHCVDTDPYAGYDGAFECLNDVGDIAFLRHTTILGIIAREQYISGDAFELLCKDGSRRPVDDYVQCNWGTVPSDAVVTSSEFSFEKREKLQKFLVKAASLYSHKVSDQNFNNDNTNLQPEYDPLGNRVYRKTRQTSEKEFTEIQQMRHRRQNPYNEPDPYNQNNQYNSNERFPNTPNRNEYDRQSPFSGRDYGGNLDQNRNNQFYNPNNQPDFTRDGSNYYGYDSQPQDNYTYYEKFDLFDSAAYGSRGNLLFQDAAEGLIPVPGNKKNIKDFLGDTYEIIVGVRDCPVKNMTLCVTSEAEREKCVKMKVALEAQLLKPELLCLKGHSQIHCMQAIHDGMADVTVLDAGDIYTAGLNFNLIPFISEVYNLDSPEYYVVAVAKESDPDTELTYLKNKNSCHGGINTAAGWIYPLAFLISNKWIRPYGCNSVRAAAEYFMKSCIPGALSTEYNTGVPYDNMCDLCHGTSYRYCRRDASEDYYGHTGAFRCLVEGGGDVAFVKHTTVTENTGGKKREWWARDNLNDDFELLCPDGTRAEVHEYAKCNLGKVKANAIVTKGGYGYNETHINTFINLFLYAQTFFGRKTSNEFSFSMFASPAPYSDLIFQDATTQLKVIPQELRYYSTYLGKDFMRARRVVDCHAGANIISSSAIILLMLANAVIIFS